MPCRATIAKCLPISVTEFARAFPLSKPPSGWSDTLIVANSGGPDSTCLLFLLKRHLTEAKSRPRKDLPKRLVSFTVDHDLQTSSSEMARHAANSANSLGVEHITEKLPWGQHRLPRKPGPGNKIEGIARMMRYKVIFEQLKNSEADAVAFGHHLDDQVETMLMRLGRGASKYGLAAMRPCRRWGMGNNSQEQYGQEGLSKWIIRPLLSFEKDRILATCQENELSYVEDPTNFQPETTLRNAIRDKVREISTPWEGKNRSNQKQPPQEIVQGLKSIQDAAETAKLNFNLDTPLDHLRRESNNIATTVREQEAQVDEIIEKCRLPSPPGTFMISAVDLNKVVCRDIKDLLLFRITRYVSPEAWGNPRAELGRRKSSVERLSQRIFISASSKIDTSICVGSHVWWRPQSVTKKGVRATVNNASLDEIAWLSQRQPPAVTFVNNAFSLEINKELFMRGDKRVDIAQVLFDRRFVIRIHPENVPRNILKALSFGCKVVIEPSQQWFLPEIILRGENVDELVHTDVTWPYEWRETFRYRRDKVVSDWATIDYVRPISAI